MYVLKRKPGQAVVVTVPPSSEPTQILVAVGTRSGSDVHLLFNAAEDRVTIERAERQGTKRQTKAASPGSKS